MPNLGDGGQQTLGQRLRARMLQHHQALGGRGLAFADPVLIEEVKIGVLAGSLVSALAGYAVLRVAGRRGG
mgnify:CR=1 FL=1